MDVKRYAFTLALMFAVVGHGVLTSRQACAALDLYSTLKSNRDWKNYFAEVDMPTADELWRAGKYVDRKRNPKLLPWFRAWDCTSLLMTLKENFSLMRPNAPDPIKDVRADISWTLHVEMENFLDLYWCSIKGHIQTALDAIDQQAEKPVPMPYRPPPQGYNYALVHGEWPYEFRQIRRLIADLTILSLRGFAPAMVKLAELSDRGDVVRLSPKFTYFLLEWADKGVALNPRDYSQLKAARAALTASERKDVRRRIQEKVWPLEDSMVVGD